MEITINDHRKIFAVKSEFNKLFPDFKLEFFEKPSKAGSAPSKKMINNESKTLGQCRTAHNKGIISISSGMTIGELEQNFSDVYELAIEVHQKTGSDWIKAESNTILS